MPARHFCCCLPLRLGAFLITFGQLIVVGLLAAVGWHTLENLRGHLPFHLRHVLIASSIFDTLLSIIALVGVYGTIRRKASLLASYASYLSWLIGIRLALNISQLVLFFKQSRQTLVKNCIDGSTDKDVQNICNNEFNTSKWTILGGMIIGLIVQIWAAYIIASYAEKLENEQSWRSGLGVAPQGNTPNSKYVNQDDFNYGANVPLTPATRVGNNSFGGSTSNFHNIPV